MKNLLLAVLVVCFGSCTSHDSDETITDDGSAPANALPAPQPITFNIDAIYPHDKEAFTQGLEFYKGKLYEGTGEPNQSTLRIVDIKSGKPEKKYLIKDSTIFGEGISIFKNKIYQLTWQNNKIFVYNSDNIFNPVATLNWPYQGWGLTNDGVNLIISDGSDKLYYVLPDEEKKSVKMIKILSVADNRGMVDSLNELEYINGYVYANRWYNNDIVKIDTANGHVAGKLNMTGLLRQYAPNDVVADGDVLNGIAYDSTTKKMYITGKNWPKLFEIRLN